MTTLIRYAYYLGLSVLVLLMSLIGCGNDEDDSFVPEVVVTPEGIIKGAVINLVTQQGVIDAHVVLITEKKLPGGDIEQEDVASTTTDASGNFIFEELKTGEYILNITARGYLGQQAPAEVTRKEPTTVNFRLEPGVRFKGSVISDDGNASGWQQYSPYFQ